MEEKNNAPQPCGEKQPESKKFLVFYVIGLFCVALALILLSLYRAGAFRSQAQ